MKDTLNKHLDMSLKAEDLNEFDAITKIIGNIYEMYGVKLEYLIQTFPYGAELRIGSRNWDYDLAAYKGISAVECLQMFQYELTSYESSNSNLRRYIESLPIYSELREMFKPNAIATSSALCEAFPNDLNELSISSHADLIEKIYEPSLLVDFLVRIAREVSSIKNNNA